VTTARGQFVVKPAYDRVQAELYARVAQALNQAGIRQARPRRTRMGALIGESGYSVQEFLPGRARLDPTPEQTTAAMRHIAAYHAALRQVPVPPGLDAAATVWARVASPSYLMEHMPGLLKRSDLPAESQRLVAAALGQIESHLEPIGQLPTQLVHGDIGPDNVLMNGVQVVAIVDFTPFNKPVLFAIATAAYWYHVYGRPRLDLAAVRASVAAASERREWTPAEAAVWPAMVMLEALRRLATVYAVAEETGSRVSGAGFRYQAVLTVMRSLPELALSARCERG
jgi:homoserine kinase type II